MRDKRTAKSGGRQTAQKARPVDRAAPGRRDRAVGMPVLCMGKGEMVPEQVQRMIDDPAVPFGATPSMILAGSRTI